jgi:hypothetical protein
MKRHGATLLPMVPVFAMARQPSPRVPGVQ